jgi:protein-tyrosine phosphatase
MTKNDIKRVCCLLDEQHLRRYDELLEAYRAHFGSSHVCHAPIPDFTTVSPDLYHEKIAPFLRESIERKQRVVIHCSAGQGRTGHVLALWLADEYEFDVEEAVEEIQKGERAPLEAATIEELSAVLSKTG